jgi:hypothetical protein
MIMLRAFTIVVARTLARSPASSEALCPATTLDVIQIDQQSK